MTGMVDASVRDVHEPALQGVDKGVVQVDHAVDQVDQGVDRVEMVVTETCGTDMNQSCKV